MMVVGRFTAMILFIESARTKLYHMGVNRRKKNRAKQSSNHPSF